MKLAGKRVLVTGAGGFIGSHLVERLVKEKADVSAFVRYNSRSDFGMLEDIPKETLDSITVLQGDITDPYAVLSASRDVDAIFHLAAMIAIPYSYMNPREAVQVNVNGTLNVLQAALENGVEKVVHTSTSEVFGTARYVPIDEKHPISPQSPYAASKAGADYLARTFHLSFDLPVTTLRPFNTYGPRQSARAIIPTIITQALEQEEICLGNLESTRDFTFVLDTVDGFVKAAEGNAIGQVMNIGSNFEISIGDLAQKILEIMECDKEIVCSEDRLRPSKSEVNRLRVDNTAAREKMGWKPRTTLDEGLGITVEWMKKNLHRYKTDRYIV